MKNTICLFLALAFSSFAIAAETVTVSGKITNISDGKLSIRGESFRKDITLKADGSFSETLNINYTGTYTLTTTDNRMSIYLAKGTKLNVTGDNGNFYKSMKFTGAGSVENQYFADKIAITLPIKQDEIYALGEKEFLAKLLEIKMAMVAHYDRTKFKDADFKLKEARSIAYFEQLYILNYPSYHAHYAKIEDFKPSESFPKLDPLLNLDDEAEYLFSNSYKQIVNTKFEDKVGSQLAPDAQYSSAVALPEIKKYKSQSIKNALLQNLAYEVNLGNPNSTALYNDINALSTNTLFKTDLTDKFNKIKSLTAGKPSPGFDYENHAGGKTSLASLKGTYVYIDVWATWCGPCRQEIPSLQKVEEQYQGKNVRFVSISIDALKDHDKWNKMVTDQKMGGVQLFAEGARPQFATDYAIDTIPRFILIDPDGNIVNADAPRPSDPKLVELFSGLKI